MLEDHAEDVGVLVERDCSSTAVFNRWTALHQVARVRELKRESGSCANQNLPLHRTVRLGI